MASPNDCRVTLCPAGVGRWPPQPHRRPRGSLPEAEIARAMFRVAVSSRREQEPSFFAVIVWRDQAEHAAESLAKGSRVVVVSLLRGPDQAQACVSQPPVERSLPARCSVSGVRSTVKARFAERAALRTSCRSRAAPCLDSK
jgi:hypothetical protein